jgi:integrase
VLQAREAERDRLKEQGKIVRAVFHRNGKQVRDLYAAWRTACTAAGVPGRYLHDFRRTAIRGWVRAGISERVAMRMSGHKTRAVFDRYNVVAPSDLKAAADKLDLVSVPEPTEQARKSL